MRYSVVVHLLITAALAGAVIWLAVRKPTTKTEPTPKPRHRGWLHE